MRLLDTLRQIVAEKRTSFHMPGHKSGRLLFDDDHSLLELDITEIPGADNLHDASGPILETERAIADFYGASESKILIGGSTAGILSMILGTTVPGDRIMLNRNAHKSIYNAIELNGLIPVYIYPEIDDYLGIPIGLPRSDVEKWVKSVKICVLTYPTYEGLCYPIEELIQCCHDHGVLVLVDEAHGAHLLLDEQGPKSSLFYGADVVVQSFHKTLPAMTQTACLHFSKRCRLTPHQKARVTWHLSALQTSSPSYVLMASVDHMLTIIEKEGKDRMRRLKYDLGRFYESVEGLMTVKTHMLDRMDSTKIILMVPNDWYQIDVWDGRALAQRLLEDFSIQVEYESRTMVLMMMSICTTTEDLAKLSSALINIDTQNIRLLERVSGIDEHPCYSRIYGQIAEGEIFVTDARHAVDMEHEEVDVTLAVGRISAQYIIPYPPGIPVLVPGERILAETVKLFPVTQTRIRVIQV